MGCVPSVGEDRPTVCGENESWWMTQGPRPGWREGPSVDHTTSKTSQYVKSVKDWNVTQGSVGKHLGLISDVSPGAEDSSSFPWTLWPQPRDCASHSYSLLKHSVRESEPLRRNPTFMRIKPCFPRKSLQEAQLGSLVPVP